MAEKTKEMAGAEELRAQIRESATQIWLAGLGAFAKAQEERARIFETLVKEGQGLQERTRKEAGETIAEMAARATGTWDNLEELFEERVARALHRLNMPTKSDIDALNRRIAGLTRAAGKTQPPAAKARASTRRAVTTGLRRAKGRPRAGGAHRGRH